MNRFKTTSAFKFFHSRSKRTCFGAKKIEKRHVTESRNVGHSGAPYVIPLGHTGDTAHDVADITPESGLRRRGPEHEVIKPGHRTHRGRVPVGRGTGKRTYAWNALTSTIIHSFGRLPPPRVLKHAHRAVPADSVHRKADSAAEATGSLNRSHIFILHHVIPHFPAPCQLRDERSRAKSVHPDPFEERTCEASAVSAGTTCELM